MAVTFLPQNQLMYPDNADVSPGIRQLGNSLAAGLKEGRDRNNLLKISQAFKSGGLQAGMETALEAGDPDLALKFGALAATQAKAGQTDELKEYEFDVRQLRAAGKPVPTFGDWKSALKRAGATNVTVNSAEKSYDVASGKAFAEQNFEIVKAATDAQRKNANLDSLATILADPTIYQGAGAEKVLQAKRIAKSIGVDVGDLGGAEAAQSISNQLALEARNPSGGAGMPGAMSDADRVYLRQIPPGIEKTPEGNKLLIDIHRKQNQRAIEVDRLRRAYVQKNGRLDEGFYQVLSEHAERNPLFTSDAPARPPAASRPRVRTYNPGTGRLE